MNHISIKIIFLLAFSCLYTFGCEQPNDDGYHKSLAIAAVNQQIEDDITIFYGPYSPDYPSNPCKFLSAYILNKQITSELYPESYEAYFIVKKIDSENWLVELVTPKGNEIEYGPYVWEVSINKNDIYRSELRPWQLFVKNALSETKHNDLKNITVSRTNSTRNYC